MTDTFPDAITPVNKFLQRNKLQFGGRPVAAPSSLNPSPEFAPDFGKKSHEFTIDSPLYGGKLVGRVYPSKNGEAQFLFYENPKTGRVFLSTVEMLQKEGKENPINKYGVRTVTPDLEGMDSPLQEYLTNIKGKQLEGFLPSNFDKNDRNVKYVSFWNFVREIPLINAYYQAQGRTAPPPE